MCSVLYASVLCTHLAGNGCFWGRQYDFVNTEQAMGRQANDISAVVGYAGGKAAGPDGKVCYYLADPRVSTGTRCRNTEQTHAHTHTHTYARTHTHVHSADTHRPAHRPEHRPAPAQARRLTCHMCSPFPAVHGLCFSPLQTVYEKLGHAEVVQVSLKGPDDTQRQEEFRRFAKTYFQQFQKTRLGMLRLVSVCVCVCVCLYVRVCVCPYLWSNCHACCPAVT